MAASVEFNGVTSDVIYVLSNWRLINAGALQIAHSGRKGSVATIGVQSNYAEIEALCGARGHIMSFDLSSTTEGLINVCNRLIPSVCFN